MHWGQARRRKDSFICPGKMPSLFAWDGGGQAPPPIFARAFMVHADSGARRSWPADLPDWVVKVLAGGFYKATGCEDLGATGRWIELGADTKSLGKTAESGEILARIYSRDRNGWVSVSAVLSGKKDEHGRLLRRIATVQPVIPGNKWPGEICTFQQGGEASYIAVVFHYGPVDTAGSKAGQVEWNQARRIAVFDLDGTLTAGRRLTCPGP